MAIERIPLLVSSQPHDHQLSVFLVGHLPNHQSRMTRNMKKHCLFILRVVCQTHYIVYRSKILMVCVATKCKMLQCSKFFNDMLLNKTFLKKPVWGLLKYVRNFNFKIFGVQYQSSINSSCVIMLISTKMARLKNEAWFFLKYITQFFLLHFFLF